MMVIGDRHAFQRALCELIGIKPEHTRAIHIDVEAGSLPAISVEQTIADGDGLLEVFRGFVITELPQARSEVRA